MVCPFVRSGIYSSSKVALKERVSTFWHRLPSRTRHLRCERGQDAVEYVLLTVLIALAMTAGMLTLTREINSSYSDAASCVTNPTQGNQGKGGGQGTPGGGKGQGNGGPTGTCP